MVAEYGCPSSAHKQQPRLRSAGTYRTQLMAGPLTQLAHQLDQLLLAGRGHTPLRGNRRLPGQLTNSFPMLPTDVEVTGTQCPSSTGHTRHRSNVA